MLSTNLNVMPKLLGSMLLEILLQSSIVDQILHEMGAIVNLHFRPLIAQTFYMMVCRLRFMRAVLSYKVDNLFNLFLLTF